MLIERAPATQHSTGSKWIWISAIVLAVVGAGIVLLATHWPFTRENLTKALENATGRPVQIGTFTQSYFPPGCTAGQVRVLRHEDRGGEPLITIERLAVRGSLTGLFTSPKRLAVVHVSGMRLRIPPKGKGNGGNPVLLNSKPGGESLTISKIVADGTLLEFLPGEAEGEVYRLKVDRLTITEAGGGAPMAYRATLTNSEPPGIIQSEGKFGPWNPRDVGATPVSGSYQYDEIDLGHFHGIAGKGRARGTFAGPMSRIRTSGRVDVAGFEVDDTRHPVELSTTFDAVVNGTNGDVYLKPAIARFRGTTVEVSGWIAGHEEEKGKTAAFEVAVRQGRVEDLLYLFSKSRPGMTGNVGFDGKFLWPPGPRKFVEKIRLDLDFKMDGSRFTKGGTQDSIDRISQSAQGESKKQEDEDPRTALSQIRGRIQLRGGVARIEQAGFAVPGATATVRGTYRLSDQRVDLHGVMDTRGRLSDTTSGFKAIVLKAITPFFKKKHHVKQVPFKITGAYGDTSVTIDW